MNLKKYKINNRCCRHGNIESNYPNKYMMVLLYDVVAALTRSSGFNLDPVQTAAMTVEILYNLMYKNRQRVKQEGHKYYAKLTSNMVDPAGIGDNRLDLAHSWADVADSLCDPAGVDDFEETLCGAL